MLQINKRQEAFVCSLCQFLLLSLRAEISPVFPIDIDISNEYRGQTVS
jgi:hypothetical protein